MEIMSLKKKKTTTTTTSTSSYIPNDIMIDILSWVPANSLLRLRWACKYWFHLITRDDDFIIKQFHRSTSTTTIQPHKLSLLISKPFNPHLDCHPCTKIFQCYIDYYYSTTTTTTTGTGTGTGPFSCGAMNQILSGIFVNFEILGSCHGLILFSYYFQEQREIIICIWNPCTKEYKYLPKPLCYGLDEYDTVEVSTYFGLGYDHSIKDYKVIHNVNYFDGSIDQVNIYTLGTNSWTYRTIETDIPAKCFGHGVFMNGALYFIRQDYSPGSVARIFSFDFEKNTHGEISNQPDCLNYYDKDKFVKGLAMFEGSLCLTMYTLTYDKIETWRRIKRFEMWVMKKDYNMNNYNQEEYSWSKLCEISQHDGLLHDFLQPLRFNKEGEILLLDSTGGLVLFDPKNNKLHPIKRATTVDPHMIEAIYIESLVSLNSGTYIDEQGDYMHYWKEERDYMHYYYY